jgi:hypothetical protein
VLGAGEDTGCQASSRMSWDYPATGEPIALVLVPLSTATCSLAWRRDDAAALVRYSMPPRLYWVSRMSSLTIPGYAIYAMKRLEEPHDPGPSVRTSTRDLPSTTTREKLGAGERSSRSAMFTSPASPPYGEECPRPSRPAVPSSCGLNQCWHDAA